MANISSFAGIEYGTFKLKEGASEEKMLEAAKDMEQEFLSKEHGFLGHSVLKEKDGICHLTRKSRENLRKMDEERVCTQIS